MGKLEMFDRLSTILFAFFAAAILCMIIAITIIITFNNSQDWYAKQWKWLWFWSAGWSLLLNFSACFAIAYLFRPRAYNRSYGLNQISAFDDEIDLETNVALETLRSTRWGNGDLPPTEGGHSRWNTGSLHPFGDDDDDDLSNATSDSHDSDIAALNKQ